MIYIINNDTYAAYTSSLHPHTKGAEGGMHKKTINVCTGWYVFVRASTAIIIPYNRQVSKQVSSWC